MTGTAERTLPHWDMTPFYPSLDSPELASAAEGLASRISAARRLFDEIGVGRTAPRYADEAVAADFDGVLGEMNAIADEVRTLRAYVHAFVTTDARNDLAQRRASELQLLSVDVAKLETRLVAWIGSLDVESLLARSQVARSHEFFVRRSVEAANHQMSEAEEDLAASLHPAGQGAWAKLHGNVTSRLTVEVRMPDGSVERLPMSAVPGLMEHPDGAVREAAFRSAIQTWPVVEVPLAAALNGVKGWQNEVDSRRGWTDPVDVSLFANNVERASLEAMHEACLKAFGDFSRYFSAKARLLGKDRLAWWDLSAPVGGGGEVWEWEDTHRFIVEQFATYSDRLSRLADRAFREGWIDAEPRDGKRSGGYCMSVRGDESRVFVNFTKTFQAVTTVAHELGHAYHNLNLAERTAYQRRTPMALAETASTFCETIVGRALVSRAGPNERLAILNGDLIRDALIVVSIHSRFLFEQALCEARRSRELQPSELCAMMAEAQARVFGDALDPDGLHPYMWCVSPHYYGQPFYNWPYTFGLLFGLGLVRRFEEDPEGFRRRYDDLLSSTGLADARTLARRFGIDIASPDFWRSSLDVCREKIDAFVDLSRSSGGR